MLTAKAEQEEHEASERREKSEVGKREAHCKKEDVKKAQHSCRRRTTSRLKRK